MKQAAFLKLLLVAALACTAAAGCKRNPKGLTYIPGQSGNPEGPGPISDGNSFGPGGTMGTGGLEPADRANIAELLASGTQDRGQFAAETVYFDFDSSVVKPEDIGKIERVASFMKANLNMALIVEGHCDDRGTVEYNRALGERRALSVREVLVRSGVSSEQIHTISFVEDAPAVEGQGESVWSKNRRGEFVLLRPNN